MRATLGRVLLAIGFLGSVVGFRDGSTPAAAAPAPDGLSIEFAADYIADVVYSPSGHRVYVSLDVDGAGELRVLDTSDWSVVASVPTGGDWLGGLEMVDDGAVILAAVNGTGEVVEFSTETNTIVDRIDLLAELGDDRTLDVKEIAGGDILVTSSPGSNGTAYIVRFDRADPDGTKRRVASGRVIRAGPRVFSDGGPLVAVGSGFSPNSMHILDVSDPDAPIVAEDAHGSVRSTQMSAIDTARGFVYTASGDKISLSDGSDVDTGLFGMPVIAADGDTMWTYNQWEDPNQVRQIDLDTGTVVDQWEASCGAFRGRGSFAPPVLTPDGGHMALAIAGYGDTSWLCVEPLDGEDPPVVLPAPDEVVARAGDGQATVGWRWDSFGVEPIDEFVVTSSPGGRTCVAQAFSCVVDGLSNGVAYSFTVAARLDGVDGNPSAPSAPVTPGPGPAGPRLLVVDDDGSTSWTFGSGGGVDELTVRYRETQAPSDWLDPLIIGGAPLTIDDHRYGVKLFSFWGAALAGECGGVLIDPEWVLTAAHCTETRPTGTWYTQVQYFSVIPGLADWTDFGSDLDRHRVFSEQIIVHPDYDRETLEHDLALVRLETPVAPDVGDTIPLYPFASLADGAQAFVSGWGADERGVLPDVVRGVEVSVDADCGSWPAAFQGFDPTETMCTTAVGEGVCAGDSGGPVVVNESGSLFLAGVVSFGSSAGCGVDPDLPDGHVRVAAYIEWIEANVGPLWSEFALPPSATGAQLDDLRSGRTYVVTVEASNDIGSAFAVRTVTTAGMRVLGPDALIVDCLTPIGHPFADVPSSSFASGSIGCIYALGITTGTSATAYSPQNFVTRGQMAAFVARFIESVTGRSCTGSHPFVDVPVDSWMNGPVGCISDLAITNGTSPTTYAPNDFVTREQMAAFVARVYRAVTGEECSIPTDFGDVPPTSFAYRDIGCIASIGVTQGTSSTTYSPRDFVTREQMAAFVERLFKTVTA